MKDWTGIHCPQVQVEYVEDAQPFIQAVMADIRQTRADLADPAKAAGQALSLSGRLRSRLELLAAVAIGGGFRIDLESAD